MNLNWWNLSLVLEGESGVRVQAWPALLSSRVWVVTTVRWESADPNRESVGKTLLLLFLKISVFTVRSVWPGLWLGLCWELRVWTGRRWVWDHHCDWPEAGDGAGGYPQYGLDSSCPEGVDQNTALLATAAAIAVGAGVIYRAVTLQQAGRRRRREVDSSPSLTSKLQDIIMMGQSCSLLSLNISAFV